jgi:hypothetical protein
MPPQSSREFGACYIQKRWMAVPKHKVSFQAPQMSNADQAPSPAHVGHSLHELANFSGIVVAQMPALPNLAWQYLLCTAVMKTDKMPRHIVETVTVLHLQAD